MNKRTFSIKELIKIFDLHSFEYEILGNKNLVFSNIKPVLEADNESLVYIDINRTDLGDLINKTKAHFVICDDKSYIDNKKKACYIISKNPKLLMLKINNSIFSKKIKYEIHPTAIISKAAKIHNKVYIGPNTVIGNCEIGEGTVIMGNCYFFDNSKIKKNVVINPGCIIGAEGVGHIKNETDVLENFTHIGGVIINDNVEIFPNVTISKGTFGNTVIEKNTIIDAKVHIGHNCTIGSNTIIIANTVIGGSTKIGKNVWISMGVNIIDNISIGDNSNIGPGSTIIQNLPENTKTISKSTIILPQF